MSDRSGGYPSPPKPIGRLPRVPTSPGAVSALTITVDRLGRNREVVITRANGAVHALAMLPYVGDFTAEDREQWVESTIQTIASAAREALR